MRNETMNRIQMRLRLAVSVHPSVRPSVRPFVRPFVRPSVRYAFSKRGASTHLLRAALVFAVPGQPNPATPTTSPSSVDRCKNVECLNGGKCIAGFCNCVNGFAGNKCQTRKRQFRLAVNCVNQGCGSGS